MKRLVVILSLAALAPAMATADVPPVLNHQGMLTDSAGTPLNGQVFMIFRLYEQASGGASIWSEAQNVSVESGIFNVYLGVVSALDDSLFQGQEVYLGVTVEDDGEMTPRLRFGSVPYAFTADREASAPRTWYRDADGDGYGDSSQTATGFSPPPGFVAAGGDCHDGDPGIHPGAFDSPCDGIDQDCDGSDPLCDDGIPCTVDLCIGGECVHQPLDCDDGLPCTLDYCNSGYCYHEPVPATCLIANTCYPAGYRVSDCMQCDPIVNRFDWSPVPNGTACSGGACWNGTCVQGR